MSLPKPPKQSIAGMVASSLMERDGTLDGNVSSSSSSFSFPPNGTDGLSNATESLPPSPPAGNPLLRELPDALIDFVSGVAPASEPPRKKAKKNSQKNFRKTALIRSGENLGTRESKPKSIETKLQSIEVKQSVWDIQFSGSKLSNHDLQDTLERSDIRQYMKIFSGRDPEYIEVQDELRQTIFHARIPEYDEIVEHKAIEDVRVALRVDFDSKKSGKDQGRLYTKIDLRLLQKDQVDILRITFTIRWNVTTSPFSIISSKTKTKALEEVLQKYFPTPNNRNDSNTDWSPQDFYRSVHIPDKNDKVPESLVVPELESTLYPFQKRSVQWMLKREGLEWSANDKKIVPSPSKDTSDLPLSFVAAKDFDGKPCFVSHLYGILTLDVRPFKEAEGNLKGGILAEEMGLGKTLEMISLITLNRRPKTQSDTVFDPFTGQVVRQTSATLIIAPQAIALQWISEFNRHAPQLKVTHYQGIKSHAKKAQLLASSDVVISTYSVLAAEIHFTQLNPEKSLRGQSKYPRPKSPLMELQFFRVVMDEAQMIESSVSSAAVVARMVPRVNSWCLSGTPVRKDVHDLLGLLVFLRYEPFASIKHIWSSLIKGHKEEFRKLFGNLALRHSKLDVRDELKLPAQRRYVITMPFTPIEEQHYRELFNEMCEEIGMDTEGTPLVEDWAQKSVAETMRKWLVRLRQSALHPRVGGQNRKALGRKDGPLRTVDEVLEVMIEQADLAVRTEQRNLLMLKLKRGQLFENSPRVREALKIWTEAAAEALVLVEECRNQLREEISRSGAGDSEGQSSLDGSESENEDAEISTYLGKYRNRLRTALELQHIAVFFCANAHFQIKSNEEMTKPNTPEFGELEKIETEGYEQAKTLRREILQEIYGKADKLMRNIAKKANSNLFVQIPEFPTDPSKGGLESWRIVETLDKLGELLDEQANQLDEWRETTIQFLLKPLVDEDDGLEIIGDEYEVSTQTQDEVIVYCTALRAVISDRHDALTGQQNLLVHQEMQTAETLAKNGGGPFPERLLELLNTRKQLKRPKDIFVRRCIVELRGLVTSLRPDAENGNLRAKNELALVEKQLKNTQKLFTEQTKTITALEKEVQFLTRAMNARLEYYKQLQEVSDTVAPYEGQPDNIEGVLARSLQDEENLADKVAQAKTKRRYLEHLRTEAANPQEERICVICRDPFEIGCLTVCGHCYCKHCMDQWVNHHRSCPICKRKLTRNDVHDITYKPQQLRIDPEDVQSQLQQRNAPSSSSSKSTIFKEIDKNKLTAIKNIDLDGPSYTTKVDTLARHLIWLRETDPGAKSIVFSQFKDFLDVVAEAFQRFRIGYSSIDKPNGIQKFKEDESIECFLLHARAHSSGLNLVNASHVFLCEPLLNTAIELQAIARVDRIGQQQETNVWLYLVDGTVEESIHKLSVTRRMEHLTQLPSSPRRSKGKGKARATAGEEDDEILGVDLEEANSMEMQQASLGKLLAKGGKGGERVDDEDLWHCLFNNARKAPVDQGGSDSGVDGEVERGLRADAAEMRRLGMEM